MTIPTALSAESVYVVSDTPGWDQILETDNFKVVEVADLGIFKRVIRNDYGSFKEFTDFCDSIKEVGLVEPIVVRPIPNNDDLGDKQQQQSTRLLSELEDFTH